MANPVKPTVKTELVPLLLIAAVLIGGFILYPLLPDQVPTHWNFRGEVDDWSSREFATFLFPTIIIGMYIMMLLLPYLDPKKERYAEFAKVYHIFKNLLVATFTVLYFITSLAAINQSIRVEILVPLIIGGLFVVMGNYMAKIKRNWFIGIRTPWTLSSEAVWQKTHQLGGKLFVLLGVAMIVVAFLPNTISWNIFIGSLVTVALTPVVYSYILYRRERP
ncbi:MAG: hypothetical protein A2840_02275 [Candidatus Buchananbacteria bacterium RIFCSPHIGHO2_01_FULL_47_11b]|uniref:DUF1648 domain-containing protein n=1 Tax=Candidatus Buchananbacteria bacterium RIFCSPHIGHO2_01_FULL_47_11b TaxID=1797537 RepID=A0A1G1Y7L9_9BACT|nr:MAG: hypothetical protein A2840_02275 [Candidatus Buchananbacteria bacterium RIFCSPHIGHO2_01_FULL_47_11b]